MVKLYPRCNHQLPQSTGIVLKKERELNPKRPFGGFLGQLRFRHCFSDALTNSRNSGCGRVGREVNSG
ncbi:hypothetical protein EP10_001627 [Geobacillus icigianus]|uniref:Uncharacterized protein n=1 Tax=Geobacillus icigianus TaxID=1430331 RepID=A0ABU6BFU9_9BACL|nr:hypothetical protein [Geobacillus icigianus]